MLNVERIAPTIDPTPNLIVPSREFVVPAICGKSSKAKAETLLAIVDTIPMNSMIPIVIAHSPSPNIPHIASQIPAISFIVRLIFSIFFTPILGIILLLMIDINIIINTLGIKKKPKFSFSIPKIVVYIIAKTKCPKFQNEMSKKKRSDQVD